MTGSGGFLGHHLLSAAPSAVPHWMVRGLMRQRLDLEDTAAVRAAFRQDRPELIVHCAALSKTSACQANPSLARRLNVDITARLAELAADLPLILLSTDLVFDGRQGNYDETAAVSPLSIYGETKVAAERIVLANPRHSVVRTSLNYGWSPTGDRSFNEEVRRAWQTGQTLRLFTDEFRSPIAAEVTAACVWELACLNEPGLYHLAGTECLSRWDIGRLLAAHWPDVVARLEPASIRDYQGPPRPADTSLNCAKVQRLLATPLPRFSDWLAGHSGAGPRAEPR